MEWALLRETTSREDRDIHTYTASPTGVPINGRIFIIQHRILKRLQINGEPRPLPHRFLATVFGEGIRPRKAMCVHENMATT